ncbi:uncharacterized protein LOC110459667 [Mizuhopecten yessoensis]|uniref:uncharacterized protein LOC110459667 n=1 Tax=Mizuhopecten yessoensis TaxID=6573 RepID=UPI000B45E09A|nr:uncharacterized protein LOC110459667 [Mizuhopecten yessoensis]
MSNVNTARLADELVYVCDHIQVVLLPGHISDVRFIVENVQRARVACLNPRVTQGNLTPVKVRIHLPRLAWICKHPDHWFLVPFHLRFGDEYESDESSAKRRDNEESSVEISLIRIKKNKGPTCNTEPWGTPAFIFLTEKCES